LFLDDIASDDLRWRTLVIMPRLRFSESDTNFVCQSSDAVKEMLILSVMYTRQFHWWWGKAWSRKLETETRQQYRTKFV